MRSTLFLSLFFNAAVAMAELPAGRAWNEEVIYFALTDRFADGDAANDVPRGSDPALWVSPMQGPCRRISATALRDATANSATQ